MLITTFGVKALIHKVQSTAGIKTNRYLIHTESCAAAPKET